MLPTTFKEESWRSQPLGRYGSVRDIADATVYLFSDAGAYVNGHALVGASSFLFALIFPIFLELIRVLSGWSLLAHAGSLDGR